MTAIRSLIVSASSWSCVTKTNVTPSSRLERLELDLEPLAQPRVERAERLVEEQHRAASGRAPGRARPAAAGRRRAGEGLRRSSPPSCTTSSTSRTRCCCSSFVMRLYLRPKRDVAGDVEVREERVALEDGVDAAPVRRHVGHVGAVEHDPAARRPLEPGDHPERGGLAAPRGAEHREELPAAACAGRSPSTATTSSKRFVSSSRRISPCTATPPGSRRRRRPGRRRSAGRRRTRA